MIQVKCEGKTCFDSEKQANSERNLIKRLSHRSKIPKRVYYCKKCSKWHLTSQMRRNFK